MSGGPLEDSIAHAMNVIYRDEKDHFREGAKEAVADRDRKARLQMD